MNRRAFLSGLIAAPAVIRVAPLMRIAPVPIYGVGPIMSIFRFRTPLPEVAWLAASDALIFGTGAMEMFPPDAWRLVDLDEWRHQLT